MKILTKSGPVVDTSGTTDKVFSKEPKKTPA